LLVKCAKGLKGDSHFSVLLSRVGANGLRPGLHCLALGAPVCLNKQVAIVFKDLCQVTMIGPKCSFLNRQ
jgi:hypothetical protein